MTTLEDTHLSRPYQALRVTYFLVPLLAGLDKFANLLTYWPHYLSHAFARLIPLSPPGFMRIVGVVEIIAALIVAIRPRVGKSQVIHCLDAYQFGEGLLPLKRAESLSMTLSGFMRKTSMVPVISDFLFDDAGAVMKELGQLNNLHDVFIVLIDSAFAFELPPVSAGWIEAFDVETGRSKVMSRRALRTLSGRTREWQNDVARMAKSNDLDVLRIGVSELETAIAMSEFIAERRLRKAA